MSIERITVFCFGASYAVALLLELANLLRPSAALRLLSSRSVARGRNTLASSNSSATA